MKGNRTLAFPATASATGSGGVFVLDVNGLLGRLPAGVRAQVAWAGPPIIEGLRRLHREPLSDALLAEVARTAFSPMRALTRVFLELMATNRDELRAALMDDLQRDEERLRKYLDDQDAVDTLTWVVSFLRSFYGTLLTFLDPAELAAVGQTVLEEALEDSRAFSLLKGQVALMAAIEASREGGVRHRAVELIDVAFLEFMQVRDQLRREGFWLSPFPGETSDDRRKDTLKYALRFREALRESDWKALDDARMGDLR